MTLLCQVGLCYSSSIGQFRGGFMLTGGSPWPIQTLYAPRQRLRERLAGCTRGGQRRGGSPLSMRIVLQEQQLLLEKSSRSKLPEKRGIVILWGK